MEHPAMDCQIPKGRVSLSLTAMSGIVPSYFNICEGKIYLSSLNLTKELIYFKWNSRVKNIALTNFTYSAGQSPLLFFLSAFPF